MKFWEWSFESGVLRVKKKIVSNHKIFVFLQLKKII